MFTSKLAKLARLKSKHLSILERVCTVLDLYSNGNESEHAVKFNRDGTRTPLTGSDIGAILKENPQNVRRAIAEAESLGWCTREGKKDANGKDVPNGRNNQRIFFNNVPLPPEQRPHRPTKPKHACIHRASESMTKKMKVQFHPGKRADTMRDPHFQHACTQLQATLDEFAHQARQYLAQQFPDSVMQSEPPSLPETEPENSMQTALQIVVIPRPETKAKPPEIVVTPKPEKAEIVVKSRRTYKEKTKPLDQPVRAMDTPTISTEVSKLTPTQKPTHSPENKPQPNAETRAAKAMQELPEQFASVAAAAKAPVQAVEEWLAHTVKTKERKGYPIASAHALLEWARSDFAEWWSSAANQRHVFQRIEQETITAKHAHERQEEARRIQCKTCHETGIAHPTTDPGGISLEWTRQELTAGKNFCECPTGQWTRKFYEGETQDVDLPAANRKADT